MHANSAMLAAELQQARRQLQAMAEMRENYVRLTICLANAIRGSKVRMVNGHPAISQADYDAVPATWQISQENGNVKPSDASPDDKGEDLIVVRVSSKPTNGHVLASPVPPPARIITP